MADLTVLARALLYSGTVVVLGEMLLPVPAFVPLSSARRRLRWAAALAMLFGPLVWLQGQLSALEMPWAEAGTLLSGNWGSNWQWLAISAVLCSMMLTGAFGRRSACWMVWVSGAAIAITLGGLGHANVDDNWPLAARTLDALHVLSMGAWIGCVLLAISDEYIPAADFNDDLSRTRWRHVSRVATVAAPLAVLTGVLGALRLNWGVGPAEVIASTWGRLLAVKVLLVGVILGLGALQRRRVHSGSDPAPRAVRLEVILAAAVVLVTAFLTTSAPAGD